MAERIPERPDAGEAKPKCLQCAHYFITYDPIFPYGCRALNFKSRVPPVREVEGASGLPCQMFRQQQKSR